jgi:hypothetical protein
VRISDREFGRFARNLRIAERTLVIDKSELHRGRKPRSNWRNREPGSIPKSGGTSEN